jgi:hypothetical protein
VNILVPSPRCRTGRCKALSEIRREGLTQVAVLVIYLCS